MTSQPVPLQQRAQDRPLAMQAFEYPSHPCGLNLQGPPLRAHAVEVVTDREGLEYAVCSCGWVSAEHVPGCGTLRLVCEIEDAEREGRRNAGWLRDAGGPVEA